MRVRPLYAKRLAVSPCLPTFQRRGPVISIVIVIVIIITMSMAATHSLCALDLCQQHGTRLSKQRPRTAGHETQAHRNTHSGSVYVRLLGH